MCKRVRDGCSVRVRAFYHGGVICVGYALVLLRWLGSMPEGFWLSDHTGWLLVLARSHVGLVGMRDGFWEWGNAQWL